MNSQIMKILLREVVIGVIIFVLIGALINNFFETRRQSRIDEKTAKREFLYNFHRTFFDNPKYRNISTAIEEQYLYNRGKLLKENGGPFSEYEIDDYLGLIYDVWIYSSEEEFVPTEIIDYQFTYYLCITQQNKEIQEYRKRLKSLGFSSAQAYEFLDEMADILEYKDKDCKTI